MGPPAERLRRIARKVLPARFRDWYQGWPTRRLPVPDVVRPPLLASVATFPEGKTSRDAASVELERLLTATLSPEGTVLYADLLYWLILRRPAEDGALQAVHEGLAGTDLTRARLVENMVGSAEFGELRLLEDLLRDFRREPRAFTVLMEAPIGPGTTERVVEVPWILSRWRGEERVLDVGYAYALRPYLSALLDLGIPRLHGVDMAVRPVPHMRRTRADVRCLPYRDEAFDLVICISTLEHIGLDNTRYQLPHEPKDPKGQLRSMLEIARVLRPGGRLLISVPLGKRGDYGWFLQYDWRMWRKLVRRTPFLIEEQEQFRLNPEGWTPVPSPRTTETLIYQDGVPGAKAVLLASLLKPT